MRFAWIVLTVLLPAAALAQSPSQVKGPCSRSERQISMGGIDIDAVKCQLYLGGQRVADLSQEVDALRAKLTLTTEDQASLKTHLGDAASREAWWARCISDPVCVTWATAKEPAPAASAPKP